MSNHQDIILSYNHIHSACRHILRILQTSCSPKHMSCFLFSVDGRPWPNQSSLRGHCVPSSFKLSCNRHSPVSFDHSLPWNNSEKALHCCIHRIWLIIVFLIFRLIEVVLRKRNCIPRGLERSVLRRWQTQLLLLIFLLTTASGAPIWQEAKEDESDERQVGEIEKELGYLIT